MEVASEGASRVVPTMVLAAVVLVAILGGTILYGQVTSPASTSSSSSGAPSTTTSVSNQDLTIAGKVTIVVCPEPAIINASKCNAADMYSSRQLVLTQAPGSSFSIPFNSDGSFTGRVPAGTYQVSISNCNFLGCNLPKPSSIVVTASQDRNYSICFNCR